LDKDKVTISDKVYTCYEYVDLAERAALSGAYSDSNLYWRRAINVANWLLYHNEHGVFLDEEYNFLTQISKYIKDEEDA
jgi:hypothetical protein